MDLKAAQFHGTPSFSGEFWVNLAVSFFFAIEM
jgi:hypothetical protein